MKKITFILLALGITFQSFGQSVRNGGFEFWTSQSWIDPTGCFASNDRFVPYGFAANVQRVTPGYHGSYAVEIQTTRVGSDTLQSYFGNGNPGQANIPGGIPYNQKATGFRMYYQSNVQPTDTALVIVIFKLAGSPIGGYVSKITGNVGTYTLYQKTFVPALTQTPDTVVFAATSSNLLRNNFTGIPGSTLIIDSVTFTGVTSQPALMNGDFENWTTETSMFPNSWQGSYPGVFQSTDKYSGSYALELTTEGPTLGGNNQAQPGQATTGNWQNYGQGGYPFSKQIDTLMFYYKYAPHGTDTASVNLTFKKNGSVIGGAGNIILAAATYTLMKVPFNVGSVPDSLIVTFQSTQNYNLAGIHIGSDLKIDNLSLASQPFGIPGIFENTSFKLYPNPTRSTISVDMHQFNGNVEQISVYDITGKLMESNTYGVGYHDNILNLDLTGFANGTYILNVKTSEGNYYQRVSKI